MATLFSGLSVFNGSTWQKYTTANSGIVSDEVKCVLADAQGTKWIGTISGMSKFFGSNWFTIRILDALASSNLNDIAVDNQNSKWFGTQRGLSKFDGLNWSTFTALDGLPDNTILSVGIDSLNRKWVCTPDQGVGMYNDTNFFQFNTGNCGILSDETRSILCDRNNTYWIGTADGLSRFKGGWTNYTTFNSGINTGAIYDMARDQSGYLWLVHTEYGISRFNGLAQWVIYNEANSALPTNYVNAVAIDNNNDKWFATDSGLVKLDAGCSVWTVYNTSNSLLPDNKVLSVAIDTFNNVWCGTNSGGLAKFTGSQWAIYTTTDGLCSNYITTLAVDNENVKWAGSSSGASMGFCENPLPAFVSDIACYPDSSHLSSTSLRVDATSKYFWDFYNNGTLDYTTPTVTHQFPLYGFFPVKLLVTNDNCYNTLLQADTVSSQPDVTITTSGNISFCSGDSVNLLADIVNYDSIFNYHYLWSNGAITPNIYVFNPGNYSVTVSNYNCSGTSDTVIHVSVYHPYANENICLVTVDSATSMNRIVWEKTPDVGTAFYNVYKETAANYYVPIGNVAFDQPSEFLDVNSDASVKSDRYKISVVDTCGNESALSSAHKTMHLTVNLGTNNQHNLIWEKYEGFPYGQFKVWRAIPPAGWIQIATIQSNIFSYTDTANIPGSVDYVIEINKGDTCFTDLGRASSGTYTTSVSNMEQYRLIGVNEHSGSAKLVLYPNPAGSVLHLRGTEGGTLVLTDATGRTVKAQPNTGSVDVSTLERGVYFVTVTTSQGVATGRFVKE